LPKPAADFSHGVIQTPTNFVPNNRLGFERTLITKVEGTMRLRFRANLFAAFVVAAVILTGCGGRKDLGTVTGTVTLDGEPLPDAQVEFSPANSGTTSYGKTDSKGVYTMASSGNAEGAALGENKVKIMTADVIERDGEEVVVKEKLPDRYHKKTTLTADVQPGKNTFDFALESGDE